MARVGEAARGGGRRGAAAADRRAAAPRLLLEQGLDAGDRRDALPLLRLPHLGARLLLARLPLLAPLPHRLVLRVRLRLQRREPHGNGGARLHLPRRPHHLRHLAVQVRQPARPHPRAVPRRAAPRRRAQVPQLGARGGGGPPGRQCAHAGVRDTAPRPPRKLQAAAGADALAGGPPRVAAPHAPQGGGIPRWQAARGAAGAPARAVASRVLEGVGRGADCELRAAAPRRAEGSAAREARDAAAQEAGDPRQASRGEEWRVGRVGAEGEAGGRSAAGGTRAAQGAEDDRVEGIRRPAGGVRRVRHL
mmetsp:Transcript_20093/g.48166  ORF Transcript_20093/g.48166 Transcript_20093/m.48166 type:complete len:306 (-) Transcript_20093:922-1839(-)